MTNLIHIAAIGIGLASLNALPASAQRDLRGTINDSDTWSGIYIGGQSTCL